MSQIHLLLFQKMGENLKYLVLFPDFNVLALLLHSIIFYVTGAGALSAWGDGPPQHPAEQGGRGLVSSLQVIISSRISLVLKRVFYLLVQVFSRRKRTGWVSDKVQWVWDRSRGIQAYGIEQDNLSLKSHPRIVCLQYPWPLWRRRTAKKSIFLLVSVIALRCNVSCVNKLFQK